MPLISVIIPVYKVEDYLHQCVHSVLHQSFKDIEVILVDDGSPDNCPKLCDEIARQDSRVIVIHKTNGGLSDARNEGIKAAKGDYVMFLDSDDYWDGMNHLENISKIILENDNVETVLLRFKLYHEESNVFFIRKINNKKNIVPDPNITLLNLVKGSNQASMAWSRVVKRSILIDNAIFFEKGLKGEDSEWFIHLSLYIHKYLEYEEYFYIYRQNRVGSITSNIQLKNVKDQFYIIDKWIKEIDNKAVNPVLAIALKGFIAYLFSIVIYLISMLPEQERKQMILEIHKRIGILRFSLNKKSKITYYLCNYLGVEATSTILSKIYKLRLQFRKI